jgi:hypothetical protein
MKKRRERARDETDSFKFRFKSRGIAIQDLFDGILSLMNIGDGVGTIEAVTGGTTNSFCCKACAISY